MASDDIEDPRALWNRDSRRYVSAEWPHVSSTSLTHNRNPKRRAYESQRDEGGLGGCGGGHVVLHAGSGLSRRRPREASLVGCLAGCRGVSHRVRGSPVG